MPFEHVEGAIQLRIPRLAHANPDPHPDSDSMPPGVRLS
jgi:hypothetical protein